MAGNPRPCKRTGGDWRCSTIATSCCSAMSSIRIISHLCRGDQYPGASLLLQWASRIWWAPQSQTSTSTMTYPHQIQIRLKRSCVYFAGDWFFFSFLLYDVLLQKRQLQRKIKNTQTLPKVPKYIVDHWRCVFFPLEFLFIYFILFFCGIGPWLIRAVPTLHSTFNFWYPLLTRPENGHF